MLVNGFANGWRVKGAEETVGHVTLISNVWASLGITLSMVSIIAFTILVTRRSLSKAMRRLRSKKDELL
jgi:nitrate reductase gamma subunit